MSNKTVYPYGTNGQLPSSIGIINDLTTGGADKALSAEMGKTIKGEVSQLDQKVNGFYWENITPDTEMGAGYVLRNTGAVESVSSVSSTVYVFPVLPERTYRIDGRVGTGVNSCLVAFYDSGGNFIAGSGQYGAIGGVATPYKEQEVTSPAGAATMKVAGSLDSYAQSYPYEPKADLLVQGESYDDSISALRKDSDNITQEMTALNSVELKESPVDLINYEYSPYNIKTDNTWGTDASQEHIRIPVKPGDIFKIAANDQYDGFYAFLAEIAEKPSLVAGTERMRIHKGMTQAVVIPEGCVLLYVFAGYTGVYPYLPTSVNWVRDINEKVETPLRFELGSIKSVTTGTALNYMESTTRLRIDLPVKDIASARIIKDGWRFVTYAIYEGAIATTKRYGIITSDMKEVKVSSLLASISTFTPERLALVIANSSNSDLSSITSVDDIVAIDKVDKSLCGRTIVALGDSSCDVANYDIWAKVLQANASRMGITGLFPGVMGSGWSEALATPNACGQWNNVLASVPNENPIVIITTGGNEVENLQLGYDATLALCRDTIATPSTPSEWAVYTLRKIVTDRPQAKVYLVSNFYAKSTDTKDSQRLVYREMLNALCDYFSCTLIDLTRNSSIRGFLENVNGSGGYHIYTPDGTHATTEKGRYLIYTKIVGAVIAGEKNI